MLVLPNAWDAGSAKVFAEVGFPAVATSSRAIAAALGHEDHQGAPPQEMLAANARIASAVTVPVTADLEAGYGMSAAELVEYLLGAGIAGLNLEDTDYAAGSGLVEVARQAKRIAEFKAASHTAGFEPYINARIDVLLHMGAEPGDVMGDIIRRAKSYAQAGADCVFPIGLRSEETIKAVVDSVDSAVNILIYPGTPELGRLRELGVRRASFGGGPAEIALAAVRTFAQGVLDSAGS